MTNETGMIVGAFIGAAAVLGAQIVTLVTVAWKDARDRQYKQTDEAEVVQRATILELQDVLPELHARRRRYSTALCMKNIREYGAGRDATDREEYELQASETAFKTSEMRAYTLLSRLSPGGVFNLAHDAFRAIGSTDLSKPPDVIGASEKARREVDGVIQKFVR
jgi:hypothetical protein